MRGIQAFLDTSKCQRRIGTGNFQFSSLAPILSCHTRTAGPIRHGHECRHTTLKFLPPLPPSTRYMMRCMSVISRKFATRRSTTGTTTSSSGTKDSLHSNSMSEAEEVIRQAILDKVLRAGRQPTAELMLRCTILDAEGVVRTISGEFKKPDLCAEHRLHPRDLRKIDSRIPNLVPTILARKEGFLVSILHIRALVKADAVILFDTYGSTDSRLHSIFLYHLEHNLKIKGLNALPYEFRALESILVSVLSALEAEMVFMRNLIGGLLAELEDDIDRDKFKRLLHYSRRLAAFLNRAKLVGEAIEEVLEQDEDLAAMYLSDKKANKPRALNDHEDLEVLLESFSKQVEEIVNEAENISNNVQSTQEIVELILDSNRNALLGLDLKVSIGTLGIGSGALVAGLFGMNLTSHLESNPYAFNIMSGVAALVSLSVTIGGLRRLAKIRKVGLSNNTGSTMGVLRGPGPGSSLPNNGGGAATAGAAKKRWILLPLRKRSRGGE